MTPRLVAGGLRPGGMQQVIGFTALEQGRGSIRAYPVNAHTHNM